LPCEGFIEPSPGKHLVRRADQRGRDARIKESSGADDGWALSEDQFAEWVNRRSNLPLAVRGHTFVFKGDNVIMVDGGKFLYEDALELVRLVNSKSPFDQVNASLMVAERNGALRLVVLALIAVIFVVVILLALH